jgi:hypothetical protein
VKLTFIKDPVVIAIQKNETVQTTKETTKAAPEVIVVEKKPSVPTLSTFVQEMN